MKIVKKDELFYKKLYTKTLIVMPFLIRKQPHDIYTNVCRDIYSNTYLFTKNNIFHYNNQWTNRTPKIYYQWKLISNHHD